MSLVIGEPHTDHTVQGKAHFHKICPCANDKVYATLEDVRTFLYVFMNVVEVFAGKKVRVNVAVDICFHTEECKPLYYKRNFKSLFC